MEISIVERSEPGWHSAAELVKERYKEAFAADVLPNPQRFAVVTQDSQVLACAGISFAVGGKLFAERYLSEPAESAISRVTGNPCQRSEIMEVGSLASRRRLAGAELLTSFPFLTWCLGRSYGLMTATKPLMRMLQNLGLVFIPIAEATPMALDEHERAHWGRYYKTAPITGVVPLSQVVNLFASTTGRYSMASPRLHVNHAEADTRDLADAIH